MKITAHDQAFEVKDMKVTPVSIRYVRLYVMSKGLHGSKFELYTKVIGFSDGNMLTWY